MNNNLPEGISAFCRKKWDEKSNSYINLSSQEVIDCCTNSCKNQYVDFCKKTCKNNQDCSALCDQLITNCKNICQRYRSDTADTVKNCIEKSGCGTYPVYIKGCLEAKKAEVQLCFNTECKSAEEDCTGFENIFNKIINSQPKMDKINPMINNNKNSNKKIFIILFTIFTTLIVLYYFYRNKSKFFKK